MGSSFSGGHVLTVAAADPRIAAVIAQAPYTDSLPVIRRMPLGNLLRAAREAMLDQAGSLRGRPPRLMPAAGEPGTFAAMTEPDVLPGFSAIVGPESLWRNEVAARLMLTLPLYRPVRSAGKLVMPVLLCVCDADTTTRRRRPWKPPDGRRGPSCAITRTGISTSTTTRRSRPTRWPSSVVSSADQIDHGRTQLLRRIERGAETHAGIGRRGRAGPELQAVAVDAGAHRGLGVRVAAPGASQLGKGVGVVGVEVGDRAGGISASGSGSAAA